MWKWVAPGKLGLSLAKRPRSHCPRRAAGFTYSLTVPLSFERDLNRESLPDHQIFVSGATLPAQTAAFAEIERDAMLGTNQRNRLSEDQINGGSLLAWLGMDRGDSVDLISHPLQPNNRFRSRSRSEATTDSN
jgi:hypothetical protein